MSDMQEADAAFFRRQELRRAIDEEQECSAYRGGDPASGCPNLAEPGSDYCAKHNVEMDDLYDEDPEMGWSIVSDADPGL